MATAIAMFVLAGALLAVPMVLRLVDPLAGTAAPRRGRWRLLWRTWLPAALSLFVSFLLPVGGLAAAFAAPWFLFTLLVALVGGLRFGERGGGPWSEVAIDAGLVLLAIGGFWALASRAGVPVLGFAEPWVGLTAAHFHFAGPVLAVVTGNVARRVPGRVGELASAGVVLGVPLVALGILLGHRGERGLELASVSVLVLAALLTALLLLRLAQQSRSLLASATFACAGCALAAGMALALTWSVTVAIGRPLLSLEFMVGWHASLQVFGFSLPSVWMLQRLGPIEPAPHMEILLPWLGDVPRDGLWEARALGPEVMPGAPGVATDRHELELPSEPPGPPVEDGPFQRAAVAVMSYRSFPAKLLLGLRAPEPVRNGETVRARYRLLPFVHLVFAARVVDRFDGVRDGVHRTGFTYRTLAGHPECGVESFLVEKQLATGRVHAVLFAHSRSGNLLTRMFRPIARRLQLGAGRAAVANLQRIATFR